MYFVGGPHVSPGYARLRLLVVMGQELHQIPLPVAAALSRLTSLYLIERGRTCLCTARPQDINFRDKYINITHVANLEVSETLSAGLSLLNRLSLFESLTLQNAHKEGRT